MITTADPPLEIDEWELFDEAYFAFCDAHPMLGLRKNNWAATNVRRNFAEALIAAGAVRQLVNRRWLAHRERFAPALFALLARPSEETIAAVRARNAKGQQ